MAKANRLPAGAATRTVPRKDEKPSMPGMKRCCAPAGAAVPGAAVPGAAGGAAGTAAGGGGRSTALPLAFGLVMRTAAVVRGKFTAARMRSGSDIRILAATTWRLCV